MTRDTPTSVPVAVGDQAAYDALQDERFRRLRRFGVVAIAVAQALAVLANYNTSAGSQGYGIGMTQQEIAQWGAVYAAGQNPNVNSIVALPNTIPASVTPGKPMGTTATIGKTDALNTTLPNAGGGTAIQPSTPSQVSPVAPLPQPVASTTPWGPILAVGGGVLVLGTALVIRARRNKKGK